MEYAFQWVSIISRPPVLNNYKLMKIDSDQKLNVNTDEIAVYSGCQINWLIYRLLPISGVSCRIFTLLIFNSPGLARGRLRGGAVSQLFLEP